MVYVVYILKSDKYSYVGMTNDFFKRWRQHNQEIKGEPNTQADVVNGIPYVLLMDSLV